MDSLEFSPEECYVIREKVGTSTNGMFRLKQVLEVLRPELKGKLLPADIRVILQNLEQEGVVPVICKRIELHVTKDENKKRMCTYYYVSKPGQILELLTMRSILDGTYRDSDAICNREHKLIMVWGADKSDTDVTLSTRVCNRKDGNSSLHVQPLACIEKCAESYENEELTIFNKEYPTYHFLQRSVNDDLQMAIITDGKSEHFASAPDKATCALFYPVPRLDPTTRRRLEVEYITEPVDEIEVAFDEQDGIEIGLPPKVHIPVLIKTKSG